MAKSALFRVFKLWWAWLTLAFVITVLSGLIYATVQQDLRAGANDPQIQMAEDAAAQLANGGSISRFVAAGSVDVTKSLAPFIIIYTQSGATTVNNATLAGGAPNIPLGIFDELRAKDELSFTWQPADGVRLAAVVKKYQRGGDTGYVLAARSLREVEKREDRTLLFTGLAWLVALGGSFVMMMLLTLLPPKTRKTQQ